MTHPAFLFSMNDTLKSILKNPLFYTAILALAHAIIAALWPTFPPAVIVAGDALVMVIAGAITGQQTVDRYRERSIARGIARDADEAKS